MCARRSTECTLPALALGAFVLVLLVPPALLLEALVVAAVVAVVVAVLVAVVVALVVALVVLGARGVDVKAADVEDAGCTLDDLREESDAVVAPAAGGGRPLAAALDCCRGCTDTTIGSTDLPLDDESDSIGAALVGAAAACLHKILDE